MPDHVVGQPCATFDGARHRLSRPQKIIALAVVAGSIGLAAHDPILLTQIVVVIFLASSAGFLVLRLGASLLTMFTGDRAHPLSIDTGKLPMMTILCPLYREADSVNNLVRALRHLDYPQAKLDVILLVEEDDDETAAALHETMEHLRVVTNRSGGPKTKPNALNLGLRHARGTLIGVYDAEDRPDRDQLRKIAAAFATDERIGCVQAHLNYYNRNETFMTRMFCLEYSLHFDYMLPGFVKLGLAIPLGGTSNFVRKEALEAVGGWDAYNVTEDADLGLRLAEHGYRLTTAASTTYEEATEKPGAWVKQRSRWLKGYLQTWLVHTREPLSLRSAVVLHFALGAVVLNAVAAPIMAISFALWLLTSWATLDQVFGGWLRWPSFMLLVVGNFLHMWLLAMAPLRRGWFGLVGSAFLLPAYWLLQSAAAYRALGGIVVQPHYWAKTDHSAGDDATREVRYAA